MQSNLFPSEALSAFEGAYPGRVAKLTHGLLEHRLLTIEALAELAEALPSESAEYNPGDLPVGIAPEEIPPSPLSVVETVRTIEQNGSWVVLKRIEQHPPYADLLASLLGEIEAQVVPMTGPMLRPEAFVFLSSPGSVTPFHFDPEHNILLQIRGSKTMTVFPAQDEQFADPRIHEAFHLGGHHRNLPWREEFAPLGQSITIVPGEAIYVPVKAPHWVQNGPEVSISLSVTWRSQWSFAEADARTFNHMLRRLGMAPKSPAPFPHGNIAKSLAVRALRRARKSLVPSR